MKAVVYRKYGAPDVLQVEEVEKPAPEGDEVLVKVLAASANPLDWHIMRGKPFVVRLTMGLLKPKNRMLGADVAGVVEAVGGNVTQFQPGDAVFGDMSINELGAFAEYVCVSENAVVLKPDGITFEEAAAVPVAAITALQGLRDKGRVQPGQKVLINGASGGVGTYAVQLAKLFGAEVTGVCSARNREMVLSIGADRVIDYTREDFTKSERCYDLIIDNVGNRSVFDYKRALNPNGHCVIIGFTSMGLLLRHMLLGAAVSRKKGKRIGLMGTAQVNKDDLLFIRGLLAEGKIASVIDRSYPLGEVSEAIRYLEEGHAKGKVVINVGAE